MSGLAPEIVRLGPTAPPPAAPAPPDPAPAPPPLRHDGWTPDRQARFLAAIADGALVREACKEVGLTPTAAYSFRRRAGGAAFALGWAAANLHARERLADRLLERALDGQVETITRADGSMVERHRYDNRLAQAMLARLDRLAAADPPTPRAADPHAPHPAADPREAARTVATGFDAYLDLIAEDAGPARLRLFVDATHAAATGCAPALALADRRRHADAPGPAPEADADAAGPDPFQATSMTTSPPPARPAAPRDHVILDPADRAAWTATDWARAEAGGLVRLAPAAPAPPPTPVPPPPPPPTPAPASPRAPSPAPPPAPVARTHADIASGVAPLDPEMADHLMTTEYGRMQILAHALARYSDEPVDRSRLPDADGAVEKEDSPAPLVWRESREVWRTIFPPPPDYFGDEENDYGDPEYTRTLTPEEQEIAERYEAAEPGRLAHARERDAWFAGGGAPPGVPAETPDPPAPDDRTPADAGVQPGS